MARTIEQITESMRDDIAVVDPSVDTYAGPVRDLFVDPTAIQVQANEEDVEHLSLLYSSAFAILGSDSEIEAWTSNYGIGKDQGDFASTTQHFCRFSRPVAGRTYTVVQGTIVTTTDGYAFRTTSTVSLVGDNADSYYNPSTRCYEVAARVNAVAVGADFNVAAYTLVALNVPVEGFDKTENRVAATGGASSEANASVVRRAQAKQVGVEKGTYGGILSDVMQYSPLQVNDASLVFQSDWPIFLRRSYRPAVDVHVIGSVSESTTFAYTSALGGETEITPDRQPVVEIASVRVNGTAVSYTFIEDVVDATKGSTRAADHVQLAAPLSANDVVTINYSYNGLLYGLQNDLFSEEQQAVSRTRLFGTDILIRGPVRVAVSVSVYVRVLASYDPLSVQSDVTNLIYEYVEPGAFPGVLWPSELQNQINSSIAGVSSAVVRGFTKTVAGDTDVETIELEKNEEPYVDTNNLSVDVSL